MVKRLLNGNTVRVVYNTEKMKTIIDKAKELIESEGVDKAIDFFQKRIADIAEPKSFKELCAISAHEAAIDFIKNSNENN
jgi:hypothetical protein